MWSAKKIYTIKVDMIMQYFITHNQVSFDTSMQKTF